MFFKVPDCDFTTEQKERLEKMRKRFIGHYIKISSRPCQGTVIYNFEYIKDLSYWAGHYIDTCEVLKPKSTRESVISVIKNNVYGI